MTGASGEAAESPRAILSMREQQIAEAVRIGSSNYEIASSLGISVKTVEYHLSRIYARLGFRSRAQLAALAERSTRAD